MSDKAFVSVTVDTSLCDYTSAAMHAIALTATHELVSFKHSGTTVEVIVGWSVSDIEQAWRKERRIRVKAQAPSSHHR